MEVVFKNPFALHQSRPTIMRHQVWLISSYFLLLGLYFIAVVFNGGGGCRDCPYKCRSQLYYRLCQQSTIK